MLSKNENVVTQTICVDNLELNFYADISLKSDYLTMRTQILDSNCYLEFHTSGNAMYHVIADMYLYDRCIGELRFSPRKPFFKSDLVNFKVSNVLLYSADYVDYITYLTDSLKFKLISPSHIEIAIDSSKPKVVTFVKIYCNKTDKDLPTYNPNYHTKHKGRIDPKDINLSTMIHWGNIASHKYLKSYNKTLELIEHSPEKKSYTEYYWKSNGLDYINNNMERTELTLMVQHAKEIDYKRLPDPNYLASVFETHCKNYFQFIQTYTNHHKKYKRDVTPINFKGYETTVIPKYKQEKQNTCRNEQIVIHRMYDLYLSAKFISNDFYVKSNVIQVPEILKNFPTLLTTIDIFMANYPSTKIYFENHKTVWQKEFENNNDLFNNRISIEDYIKSLKLTNKLLFESIDYSDPKYSLPWYQNLTNEQLMQERLTENRANNLQKLCDSFELKKIEAKSNNMKKVNKIAVEKVDYNFKQDKVLRDIDKNNEVIRINSDPYAFSNLVKSFLDDNRKVVTIDHHEPLKAETIEVIEPTKPECYYDLNLPSILNENIIEQIETNTPIEPIDFKYQNLNNIQCIKDMYMEFINKNSNNSKLSINDYIKLLIYIASNYSTTIRYFELNAVFENYNLIYHNSNTDSILQKLITKEIDINNYNTELVF